MAETIAPEVLKDQGNSYFKQQKFDLAISLYSQAIEQSENESAIYYANRANAFFQLGNFAEARKDAEKSIEIDKTYMKAHWRLAEICRCTGRQEEALQHYKDALEISPKSRMIAEQVINVTSLINATKHKPKVSFFAALKDIPSRSFAKPTGDMPNMRYPGMNSMFSNMYGATSSAPATVNETERDFEIPASLTDTYSSGEERISFLNRFFQYCCDYKVLHSEQVLKLIQQAGSYMDGVKAFYQISVTTGQKITIVGDLHGSIVDFKILFSEVCQLERFISSNDVLVILGDYVDRGQYGHQIVCFICALKLLCPDRVHLIRGNHETASLNNFFGYQNQVETYYGSKSQVFSFMSQFFSTLPLLLFIQDKGSQKTYACFHGGAPLAGEYTSIENMIAQNLEKQLEPNDPISQQLLWSDPAHEPMSTDMRPSHRGVGYVYSKQAFEKFRQQLGLAKVFRGHEVVFERGGVRDDFGDQTHYTVFSSSNYMDQGNIGGVAAIVAGHDGVEITPLVPAQ